MDTGGTFTDIVGTDKWGKVIAAKALTTPPNSEEGVMKAISVLGGKLRLKNDQLLRQTESLHSAPLLA